MRKKSTLFLIYLTLLTTLFYFTTFYVTPSKEKTVFAQRTSAGEVNPLTSLLTSSHFSIKSNTTIDGVLSTRGAVRSPLFEVISQGQRGRIYTTSLTEERRYVFPDISGEVCLSAGNCTFADRGTPNVLAKFTATGFGDSSVFEVGGNVGVGKESPAYELDVAGRIQADGDICTNIGDACLSSMSEALGEQEGFSESIIAGEGKTSYLPIWKSNQNLGDSIIYQSESNIGIGTVPTAKLDIAGTVRMLGFRLPVNPEKGYGLMSDERGFGTWKPVLTPEGTAADIAERFAINPICKKLNNCPEPGDLVSIVENEIIKKSSSPYEPNLIGIISTKPELTLNAELDHSSSRAVALIGRVPTKISLENGEISAGDYLTSSSTSGMAMRAVKSGRVVGIALESFSATDYKNGKRKIQVLINPHHYTEEKNEEEIILTDKKTGKKYCLEMVGGKLTHSLCR